MRQLAEARALSAEVERQSGRAIEQILLRLLDVTDAFERVFRHIQSKADFVTPQMKIWIGNFQAVYRVLDDILIEQGLTPIENLDQGFDPHWHKVVDLVDDPTKKPGTIVEEVNRGYVWHTHVLRKAEVVVVRNQERASPQAGIHNDQDSHKEDSARRVD
jgi:molecular chaperone GrpE